MPQINFQNFLRWDDLGNNPSPDTSTDIAEGYLQDRTRCDYAPTMVHSEAMRFYLNSIEGLPWITDDPAACTLDLVNAVTGITTKNNCAPLQIDLFTNSTDQATFNFYGEVIITAVDADPANYYFKIVGPTGTVWMSSNTIRLVATTDTATLQMTSLCKWRHDRYWYGFRYNALADFTNQFRLAINMIDEQEESTVDTYQEVTTGKRREYNLILNLIKTAECYYFDKAAYESAIVMFKSSIMYINGRLYMAKDTLKKNTDPRWKQSRSSIILYDEDFATINNCQL